MGNEADELAQPSPPASQEPFRQPETQQKIQRHGETEKEKHPRGLAIVTLCGSIFLLMIGIFWLLVWRVSLGDNSAALLPESSWMGLLVFLVLLASSTFGGGVITLYHSIRVLLAKNSQRLLLPSCGSWLLVYLAILLSGYGVHSSGLDEVVPALGILLPLLAGVLPVITIVAGTQLLPIASVAQTWRRLSMALVCGALVAFHSAGLLIILLDSFFEQRYHACVSPICAGTPEGYSGFVFLALAIPLIEELIKPLPLIPFLPKIASRAEALWLGMICGAGYGCIEGFIFILLFPTDWLFIAAISATFALLHGLTCGWMTLGYYQLSDRSFIGRLKAPGFWLVALLIHVVFNGSFALFLLPGNASQALKFGLQLGIINLDAVGSSFVGDLLLLGIVLLLTFWRAGASWRGEQRRIGVKRQMA